MKHTAGAVYRNQDRTSPKRGPGRPQELRSWWQQIH